MISVDEIRLKVRDHYKEALTSGSCGCGDCCGPSATADPLAAFEGPSLGCGAPLQFAELLPGETVVDLGSGAGRETLLAAGQVGAEGRAVGIDMTPEMIARARQNADRAGIGNAEFRLGEIEHIPLGDREADVVISNCVLNLLPDKSVGFREAFRILRQGGRMVVSDIVTRGPLPEAVRANAEAWAGCVAGAMDLDEYVDVIRGAGFGQVEVIEAGGRGVLPVFSATIRATKPEQTVAGSR